VNHVEAIIHWHRLAGHLEWRRHGERGSAPYRRHDLRFSAWVDAWFDPHLSCRACFAVGAS